MNYKKFLGILDQHQFKFDRREGSHRQYEGVHSGQTWLVTVAYHSETDEIKPGTLK